MYKKHSFLNYYFPTHDKKIPGKWTLLRELGKEQLTLKAQLKLEWIIFYNTVGKNNALLTAAHFGINPKTGSTGDGPKTG